MITFSCPLKIYGAFYILEIKFKAYWFNLVTIYEDIVKLYTYLCFSHMLKEEFDLVRLISFQLENNRFEDITMIIPNKTSATIIK